MKIFGKAESRLGEGKEIFLKTVVIGANEKLFTYKTGVVDGELVGRRALVPFVNRLLTAIVVAIDNDPPKVKIRAVKEFLDDEPIFTPAMVDFLFWMSKYYAATPAETFRAAIPQGLSVETVFKIKLAKEPTHAEIDAIARKAPIRANALAGLISVSGDVTLQYLKTLTNKNITFAHLETLRKEGWIDFNEVLTKEIEVAKVTQYMPKVDPKRIIPGFLTPKYMQIYTKIWDIHEEHGIPLTAAILKENGIESVSFAKSFERKDLLDIKIVEKEIIEEINRSLSPKDERVFHPNDEQSAALEHIIRAVDGDGFSAFLLHGVTGSGKTLVYMKAIEHLISLGKSALLIVPEIALTPQLIDRFENYFPERVAVIHSKLTEQERFRHWNRALSGEAKIVIGARSGIFAPLKNIGLIIVDEEHETSFKQESPSPRYHARDAAVMRASFENCPIVLGSATPSIESMNNAVTGKYALLELNKRADNARMPEIRIIDMIDAKKQKRVVGSLSKDLIEALELRVSRGEGSIIYQNRRGYSPFLQCTDCGWVPECPNCAIKLTFHKQKELMICHYCGHAENSKIECPQCHSHEIEIVGYGTQRIEEEIKDLFSSKGAEVTVERIDLDTTSRRGSQRKILERFASGETDILVGTQMVAKGMDFERVTLVGVINADIQLYYPDFRASERTFQLLTQVSGRAGRSRDLAGEVIIQTFSPTNLLHKFVRTIDYNGYFNLEIEQRKSAVYPPYSRFIRIEINAQTEAEAEAAAQKVRQLLPANIPGLIVMGPVAPQIVKLRKWYRRLILIKSVKTAKLSANFVSDLFRDVREKSAKLFPTDKIRIKVDIDSYEGL